MTRALFGLVIVLAAAVAFAGQGTPSASTKDGQVMYASGFEILNRVKNGNELGFFPLQVLAKVRRNWYPQVRTLPESSNPGITIVDFEVDRDGVLSNVRTVKSSGEPALDNAASEAISASAPFRHLPEAYKNKAVNFRMHFGYRQPASANAPICNGPNYGAHTAVKFLDHVDSAIAAPRATYSPDPEFSDEARRERYMSAVQIAGTVEPDGAFDDLCVSQAAGAGLDEQAIQTVARWKFEPATQEGQPIATRIKVEVSFRLY